MLDPGEQDNFDRNYPPRKVDNYREALQYIRECIDHYDSNQASEDYDDYAFIRVRLMAVGKFIGKAENMENWYD